MPGRARHGRRGLGAAVIALALLALAPAAASATTYTVDSVASGSGDSLAGDDICSDVAAPATCTLRAAIQEANGHTGFDFIVFDETLFDGTAGATITLTNMAPALPAVTTNMDISAGDCDAGVGTRPCAGLAAVAPSPPATGLTLSSGWVGIIDGLSFTGFTTAIQADAGPGTFLRNWFGLGLNGTTAGATSTAQANGTGLSITSDGATVGSSTAGFGNVFSRNTTTGLLLNGSDTSVVRGNSFGTLGDGTVASGVANLDGMRIRANGTDDSTGTEIGNADSPQTATSCDKGCNVFANSSDDGVDMADAVRPTTAAEGTLIHGNYIGLTAAGGAGVLSPAGGSTGVDAGQNQNVVIGGSSDVERNYFADFNNGVESAGTATDPTGLVIRRNWFGLAPDGTTSVPLIFYGMFVGPRTQVIENVFAGGGTTQLGVYTNNGRQTIQGNQIGVNAVGSPSRFQYASIFLQNDTLSLVGGTSPGQGNVIAGTASATTPNIGEAGAVKLGGALANVVGNYIGTDPTQTADLGGASAGVVSSGSFGSAKNIIGGTTAASANVISNQDGPAIEIRQTRAVEVKWNTGSGNDGFFIDNQLPIGQGNNGFDPGSLETSGANEGLEPPAITAVDDNSASGTSHASAIVRVYDKSSNSPGELGALLGTVTADGDGDFVVPFSSPQPDHRVIATQSIVSDFFNMTTYYSTSEPSFPDVHLTKTPPAVVRKKLGRKAKLKFGWVTPDIPNATSKCSFVKAGDPENLKACSPILVKKVKVTKRPQTFDFAVRSTDVAGNTDPSPATTQVTVKKT